MRTSRAELNSWQDFWGLFSAVKPLHSYYDIRRFVTLDEYRECVELQDAIWGKGFSERVAVAILKVSQRLGGIAAGAYEPDGTLAGFVFGMTGVENGRVVHWSDMLGVRPGLRDSGLGTELKRYQRTEMMAAGVGRIYWTFDPLQSRNAHLNFNKLGIVVREYARDMYGDTDSHLHAGIGTDRFVAIWELESERVIERLSGDRGVSHADEAVPALIGVEAGEWPDPATPNLDLDAQHLSIMVPGNLDALKADSLGRAIRWREVTRQVFTHYLDAGYEVTEFVRKDGAFHYILERR